MTTIRFQFREHEIRSVEFTGHAGYGEAGEDIVCSAVSSAVMLADALLEDVWGIPIEQEVEEEAPRIRLSLPKGSHWEKAQDAFQALLLHFRALKEEYPDFIEVLEV